MMQTSFFSDLIDLLDAEQVRRYKSVVILRQVDLFIEKSSGNIADEAILTMNIPHCM